MAKEALPANTTTKETLRSPNRPGAQFGTATFGTSTFGQASSAYTKVALSTNTPTKQALTNQIT